MLLRQMAQILGSNLSIDREIRGFETDSRKVEEGFVFFALKGEKSDGHLYLMDVAKQGALCAVVSKEFQGQVEGLSLIPVNDVLMALQKLARERALADKMKCIAVTGSVGKTTTKEFIATLLEGSFSLQKTPGNANSQVGLALSLLNRKERADIFIAEMGMTGHGDIGNLIQMIPPDIAVVTKIALAHALYFPNGLEEVAQAKSEILLHPHTKRAFINVQARSFKAFQGIEINNPIFYGLEGDPFSLPGDTLLGEKEGAFFIKRDSQKSSEFSLPFQAKHFCENFLGAALVAKELGISEEEIFERAKNLTPYKMRFETIEKDEVTYINDAYNANPASMRAALQNLPFPKSGGKVIAVLGDMLELGIFSEKAHREMGVEAAQRADLLLCFGKESAYMAEEFSKSKKPYSLFFSLYELKKELNNSLQKGDVVLLKGSNSLKLWSLLDDVDKI